MAAGKPTRAQLDAARNKTVRDVIAADLKILFCGINPGLYTAAVGHHFARPGNRFWPTLHRAGFTSRVFAPQEEHLLLNAGYGITNVVARTTANAAELSRAELRTGARRLRAKVKRYRPAVLAILGIGAYRLAFDAPQAQLGRQEQVLDRTVVWVLPNPSGLNAHYQLDELATLFRALRLAANRLR